MTTNKITIQVGDEVIELLGEEKEAFLARVAEDTAKVAADEAEKQKKIDAKEALLSKLGITADEAALLA